MKDSIVKCPLSKSLVSFFILSSRLCILHFLGHGCPLELSASLALANEVDYPTPVFTSVMIDHRGASLSEQHMH